MTKIKSTVPTTVMRVSDRVSLRRERMNALWDAPPDVICTYVDLGGGSRRVSLACKAKKQKILIMYLGVEIHSRGLFSTRVASLLHV